MDSISEQQEKAKRSEKRRELFKQQQQAMLEGYNQNSFKSSKPKKQKSSRPDRDNSEKKHRDRKAKESQTKKEPASNQVSSRQKQSNQSYKNQQDFANVLDQMSLNSTSKMNQTANQLSNIKIIPKPVRNSSRKYESSRPNGQNLNLSKSQTGLISSILKGQPIDMKIKDASHTINSSQNALNSLIETSQIEIEINDELNRQKFAEENPYGATDRLNKTDYQGRNLKQASSREKKSKRRRSSYKGPSPFEKFEEIRFECFELTEKMKTAKDITKSIAQQLADTSNTNVNLQKQTIEVPIDMIERLLKLQTQVCTDFEAVQGKWSENFDDQQQSHSRQRSKNKQIKRKLKEMQNRSNVQADQQKEIEDSLYKIRDAHSYHANQMEEQLDQIENHVSNLKDTRQFLNGNYETQLDKACKEMVNFYQNLENAEPNDIDSDNMSIEQMFFIKPTTQISQSIQQRSKSHLRLSHTPFSQDAQNNKTAPRAHSSGPQRAPYFVPKLQIERINNEPEPPRILNIIQNSNRESQRQNINITNQAFAQAKSPEIPPRPRDTNRNALPKSGRKSNRNPALSSRLSARGPAQISSRLGSQNQNSKLNSKRDSKKQEEEIYITNPVMAGAMQLSSRFDNKYEDDYDGANVTLDMKTERLRQFPEEYEAINSIQNPDERIILKQVVFMQYEKVLKKQAKIERKRKKKALKQQQEAAALENQNKDSNSKSKNEGSAAKKAPSGELQFKPKSMVPTPTHKSSFGFGKFQNQQQSSKGSLRGIQQQSSNSSLNGVKNAQKGLGKNERHEYNENSQLTSRFSLRSELPPLDTQGILIAQFGFEAQDVNKSELLECEEDLVLGMKTATQSSLINHYEDIFKNREILKQQHKADEKKIEYNSTHNSKISNALKQVSQGSRHFDIKQQYASNQSKEGGHLIYIESEDFSINSDIKDQNKISNKKEQLSIKGKNPKIFNDKSFNNHSVGIEQSMNVSLDHQHSAEIENFEDQKVILNYDSRHDDLLKPLIHQLSDSQANQADDSNLSGASHYQRFLDLANNDYTESPVPNQRMKNNSYLISENTPVSHSNHEASNIEDQPLELDIEDLEIQNKKYLDHIGNEFRQRLPLDVIHERQSEFSQSMITNAKGVITNRSMQSKNPNHYSNLPQNATVSKNQHNSVNFALLSNRESFINNQSSANRKNSSRGIMQDSFDRKNDQEFAEEQYRNVMIRSNSVAQTHRNSDQSFVNPPFRDDQPICIDGSLIHNSRNAHAKNSSSSKEHPKKEGLVMFRQPSASNFDRGSAFFQNIDHDLQNVMQQKSVIKNKANVSISSNQPIPPSGKKQVSEKKIINTRNNAMYAAKSGKENSANNVNTTVNDRTVTEQSHKYSGAMANNQHLLSYRSYNNQGGESFREMRDRSYFDESPAVIFHPPEEIDADYPVSRTRNPEDKNLVENSVQSHLVSVQVYQTESVDSLQNQKFGTSIRTNQILHSIPQSSGQSSVKATDTKSVKSKHLRSKESYKEKESMNQIDSQHHQSADHSHKEMLLNSSGVQELNQIKENQEIQLSQPKAYQSSSHLMIRSNSYEQLRDKEFFEMCLDDYDVAIAEQNIFEVLQLKQLNQSKQIGAMSTNLGNQSHESPAQMLTSNILLNKLTHKYQSQNKMQTQSHLDQECMEPIGGQTRSIVDQNSSQQQTRGQRTFSKFLLDPNRGSAVPQMNSYLGTNLLTKSLDVGTDDLLHNLMNPTLYKRTLLMMANLHNNYLHSVNSGTLFTMRRGWNSGYSNAGDVNPQIGRSFNNLTNMVRLRKEFIQNNQSTTGASGMINGLHGLNNADRQGVTIKGHQALKSLGGEPVNISHLLLGAKQQTADRINVGSITIVDDNKNLLDRKLFLDANTSSQQTKGRKIFNQSRNQTNSQGQQTNTQDISNLQTKQLGIFKQRASQGSIYNFKPLNERKESESNQSINMSQIINEKVDIVHNPSEVNNNTKGTPNQMKGIYGVILESEGKNSENLSNLRNENYNNYSSDKIEGVNESKSTIKPQYYINQSENQNKIMNLLAGLKQIQQKGGQGNYSHRSGSDLSINSREVKSATNFRTLGQEQKSLLPQENMKKIIKIQQHKNLMNMSSSMASANNILDSVSNQVLKSKSVPKGVHCQPMKRHQLQPNIVNSLLKGKDKVKVILNESSKKNKKSLHVANDETLKNFNTITGQVNNARGNQSQLSSRGKLHVQLPVKNARTNSSCMNHLNNNFMIKKGSNVTTLSSARGSSNGALGRNAQGENLYMDPNGKMLIKKKINLKQHYNTAVANPKISQTIN